MPETPTITPILTPIKALLSSRAFLLALATFIVDAVIIAVPSLEPFRGDFMNTVTVLIGLLVAKMTIEDVNNVHSATKVEVARHQANATVAAAQIAANTIAPPDADTQPVPPVNGSTLH